MFLPPVLAPNVEYATSTFAVASQEPPLHSPGIGEMRDSSGPPGLCNRSAFHSLAVTEVESGLYSARYPSLTAARTHGRIHKIQHTIKPPMRLRPSFVQDTPTDCDPPALLFASTPPMWRTGFGQNYAHVPMSCTALRMWRFPIIHIRAQS